MIILLVLFIYLLFSVYVNQNIIINEHYSICGIIIISIFVFRYVQKEYKDYANIILLGYLLRLFVLFLDYYKLASIPCSGADSETFYGIASNNIINGTDFKLTNYTVFLTFLFEIVGPQRLFAQYINVLLGLCTIVYTCKTLKIIDLDRDSLKKTLILVSFFPQLIFLSSILLRESIIICTTTVSVYYFIKSIILERRHYIYMAIFFALIAAYMHSGMIGVVFGYLFSYIFYSYQKSKFIINYQTVFFFGLSIGFVLIVVLQSGLFTDYFSFMLSAENAEESEEALLERVGGVSNAGSAYLTWLEGANPIVIYLSTPLRIFYFLFSPIPLDWRHLMDVLTFLMDSSIYLYLLYTIIKYLRNNIHAIYSSITYPLLIGFFVYTFIYGFGTNAAGTAVRHRAKCFPLLVIVFSVLKKENDECIYVDMIDNCSDDEI